ncbi:MAG: radical SAM protein [bacterium]
MTDQTKSKQQARNRPFVVMPFVKNRFLVSFPTKKTILETDQQGVDELNKFYAHSDGTNISEFIKTLQKDGLFDDLLMPLSIKCEKVQYTPTSGTLQLTMDCNLRCPYCYSSGGDLRTYMNMDIAKAAVNFIVANNLAQQKEKFILTFHGGGEPTLNWNVLIETTKYIRKLSKALGLKPSVTCGTNGCIPVHRLNWIIENLDSICLSIDGPRHVHNAQRKKINGDGSFDDVCRTLRVLESNNFSYNIRTTTTKKLLTQLPEYFQFLKENAPSSRGIQMEPMFPVGRALKKKIEPPTSEEFLTGFQEAQELSKKLQYPVTYAACNVEKVRNEFCGAYGSNFIVTSTGFVTTCYEVATPDDSRWELFHIGRYDDRTRKFFINYDAIKNLRVVEEEKLQECRDCIAFLHCAGDCPAKRVLLDSPRNGNPRCLVTRALTEKALLEKAEPLRGNK